MIAVNVSRHAGNIALAPFVLVGLRAQDAIENRVGKSLERKCKIDRFKPENMAACRGGRNDQQERQATGN